MASRGYDILWSKGTYKICDVVKDNKLPITVKVDEGIYGSSESESFSQGDLLKLDCVQTLTKVVTCVVDRRGYQPMEMDEHGYVQCTEDMTIPLGYKGSLNILHPNAGMKVYSSVRELAKSFPRCVKVLESFTDQNGISVHYRDTLELEKSKKDGIVCKRVLKDESNSEDNKCSSTKQLFLKIDGIHKFLLMPDDHDYTIQEVVERFPLPQYVTFKEGGCPKLVSSNLEQVINHKKEFEGTYKLKETIDQQMIIGHYKPPSSLNIEIGQPCERTLVMIPIDSPTASEIDVKIPLFKGDIELSEYQLFLARNFSKKNVEDYETIEGYIYMNFLKNPKPAFIKTGTDGGDKVDGDYVEMAGPMAGREIKDDDDDDVQRVVPKRKNETKGCTDQKGTAEGTRLRRFSFRDFKGSMRRMSSTLSSLFTKHQQFDIASVDEGYLSMDRRKSNPKEWFESLSTKELCRYFSHCGLDEMEVICKRERLDGNYFRNITDEELKSKFALDRLQLIKFRKMQTSGWYPA